MVEDLIHQSVFRLFQRLAPLLDCPILTVMERNPFVVTNDGAGGVRLAVCESGNTCISQPFTIPSCKNEARSASSYSRKRCPAFDGYRSGNPSEPSWTPRPAHHSADSVEVRYRKWIVPSSRRQNTTVSSGLGAGASVSVSCQSALRVAVYSQPATGGGRRLNSGCSWMKPRTNEKTSRNRSASTVVGLLRDNRRNGCLPSGHGPA
jgi:hypothetical protein